MYTHYFRKPDSDVLFCRHSDCRLLLLRGSAQEQLLDGAVRYVSPHHTTVAECPAVKLEQKYVKELCATPSALSICVDDAYDVSSDFTPLLYGCATAVIYGDNADKLPEDVLKRCEVVDILTLAECIN